MRSLLLALFSFILFPFSGNAQTGLLNALPQTPLPPNPIKVSEINANLFSALYDIIQIAANDLLQAFVSLGDFVAVGNWILASLEVPETYDQIIFFVLQLPVTLTVTFFLAKGLSFLLRSKINSLLQSKNEPSFEKTNKLFLSAFLSILIPFIFGFSFYALSRLISPDNEFYLAITRILSSGAVSIWILLDLANLFLRPSPTQQHIPLSPDVLHSTYIWIRRMALIALLGYFALELGGLINLPLAGKRLLHQGSGIIVMLMAIFMMGNLHKEIKGWVRTQQKKKSLSPLKRAMLPYLKYSYFPVIIFIVVGYASWTTRNYDSSLLIVWKGLITLAIFPVIRLLAFCLRKIRILYIYNFLRHTSPLLTNYISLYSRQIDLFVVISLNILVAIFVLNMWGINPLSLLLSPLGKILIERIISICFIMIASLGITRAGNSLLNRYLKAAKATDDEVKLQKLARYKTIHSVSRNVLRIAIWTPAVLLIAIELGVNIIPLLTTVGILSVGLSFGIQSLVKDFVTGFFMLLENSFAVGDLVSINGQQGRIESLTIRVVRLRATDGSLYTFPYGNIDTLCNQNRDFSAAVMLFQVGIGADLTKVFDILEKISKDLRKDPIAKTLVVGPITIDGVNSISDCALEIRATLRTKPGEYYKVRWAFNRLLKQYLEEEKIPAGTPRQLSYNYPVEK
jgi:small conductance mechanosensitive channel